VADSDAPDALDALSALIGTMETQRDDARRLLRQCTPADGVKLAEAIRALEAKLEEARAKGDALRARRGRIARMKELQGELKALTAEMLAIPEAERAGARGSAIRTRFDAIQGEADELRKAREEAGKG
jgi:hypothetical protein